MLGALYDWAFSSDGTFVKVNNTRVVLVTGDKVRVFSDRHQCWFDDGEILCTYRDKVKVQYGKDRYFGFAMTRGNIKYIMTSEIEKKLRVLTSHFGKKKTYVSVAKS